MRKPLFGCHATVAVAATCFALGCGARTDMLLPGSSDGDSGGSAGGGTGGSAGSTGGSSIGGSGGAAGTGGGPAGAGGSAGTGGASACAPLGLTAGPIAFSANNYAHRATPQLAPTGGTTSTVGVAVAEMPVESPAGAAAALRLTGFGAWDAAWPESLGSGTTAGFVVGVGQFVVGRGVADDTIAVAYPASPQPPAPFPDGVLFQRRMNVFTGTSPEVSSLADAPEGHELARFATTGAIGTLVGVQITTSDDAFQDSHEMVFCFDPLEPDGSSCVPMVACGTQPVDADATALDNGFLFAASSSNEFAGCLTDDSIVGPPNRIVVGFVGGPGGGYEPLPVDIEQPDDVVSFVRVLPHSAGAWVVYQYAGLNAEQPPPLTAILVAEDGSVLLDATPLVDGSQFFEEPAVTTIGDQLLVAWVDAFDPSGDAYIIMRVFDDAGSELTQNAYARKMVSPRLSALGSPDGSHVLIGWSEQTGADGAGEDQAYVARFTCGAGQI